MRQLRRWLGIAVAGAAASAVALALFGKTLLTFAGFPQFPDSVHDSMGAVPGVTSYNFKPGDLIDARGIHRGVELEVWLAPRERLPGECARAATITSDGALWCAWESSRAGRI